MPETTAFQPEHFINRELSWLEFNARVLEEAQDASNPLLERVKFLSIFSSNLDEFFMVRVAGLREQAFGGVAAQDVAADGLDALTQLQRISTRTRELVVQQYRCWNDVILPALVEQQIVILKSSEFDKPERRVIDEFFRQRAFPILTPMAIDPSHPSPRFHNRGLYLAAMLRRTSGLGPPELFAVVQLPQVLPRFVDVGGTNENKFVLLEDIVACKLSELFGGYESVHHATFRLTRDMDVDMLEQESDDMLRAIESRLRARQHSEAVRLEVQKDMGRDLLDMLVGEEQLQESMPVGGEQYSEVYRIDGMLDMSALSELTRIAGHESLRDAPFASRRPLGMRLGDDLFAEIADHDVLLHHPFDSFDPVVDFIQAAAEDPNVLAIKQTLYRTSGDSPIVKSLMQAAENVHFCPAAVATVPLTFSQLESQRSS